MTLTKVAKRPPTAKERVPILAGAEAAMKRAGERARRLAAETTGELVVFENGRVVRVPVARTEASEIPAAEIESRQDALAEHRGAEAETPDRGADETPDSR